MAFTQIYNYNVHVFLVFVYKIIKDYFSVAHVETVNESAEITGQENAGDGK
jgi:hypothetical protein